MNEAAMKLIRPWLSKLCVLLASGALLIAAEPLQPRKGEVSASGLYVPVAIDGYASDSMGEISAHPHVTVANIPFDLVTKPGADNFFLKSAGWPDWQKDPS